MAAADEEAMEGGRGGFGVEEATGPVGAVSGGGYGRGCRSGIFAHHGGGVRGSRKSAPGRPGDDSGGVEEEPRPALECIFPLFFHCGRAFFFFLSVGGVGGAL